MILTVTPASLMAFDATGMSVSMGSQASRKIIGHHDSDHDCDWNSIGIFGRDYLHEGYLGSKYIDYIDHELDLGYMKWTPKGKNTDDTVDTFSLEGRIMLHKGITKKVGVGFGFGLAVLSDKSDTYQLTKDGLYGLITGRIRLSMKAPRCYSQNGETFCPSFSEFGVDLEIDHISSVFGRDPGENVCKARAYIVF